LKQKAFTLIELLVVVAIIGILAAVGVVAYNGYTASAKKKTLQANHKMIVKYIHNELMKCEIGGEVDAHTKYLSNPSKYNGWGNVSCATHDGSTMAGAVTSYIERHIDEFGITNVFWKADNSPVLMSQFCPNNGPRNLYVGRIHASPVGSTDKIFVCARYGTGANDVWSTTFTNPAF